MKRSPLFLISKVIIIQVFFYLTAKYASRGHEVIFLSLGIIFMLANYFLIKPIMKFKYYLGLMALFFCAGLIQDIIFIHFGILKMNSFFPPVWFPTLWMVFLAYYGDVFNKMLSFPIWVCSIGGAIGGVLAHYRGISVAGIETHPYFYYFVALDWIVFMPFSLRLFRHLMLKSTSRL